MKSTFKKNYFIAITAVFSALIIVMTFVPYLGYISYGGLSITLIHIPVIIGACLIGVKGGAILGSVWGVSCMLKAITAPPTPLEGIIFRNPLISFIPRLLMGVVAALIFKAFKNKNVLGTVCSAISACFTNTIFVMGGIYLFYGTEYGADLGITSVNFGGLTKYILAAFTVNALIEIASAVVISIPTVEAIKRKPRKEITE